MLSCHRAIFGPGCEVCICLRAQVLGAKRKKGGSGGVSFGAATPANKRNRKKKNPKLLPSKVNLPLQLRL